MLDEMVKELQLRMSKEAEARREELKNARFFHYQGLFVGGKHQVLRAWAMPDHPISIYVPMDKLWMVEGKA